LKAHAASLRNEGHRPVGARVEHIILDGEPDISDEPVRQPHRVTLHRFTLPTRPDGCYTELSILEGHFLGVRSPGAHGEPCEYQFDLRFANPMPALVRRIPWAWLLVAAAFWAFGFGALEAAWSAGGSVLSAGVTGGLFAASIGILALYVCLRRTTESLQLRSVHGAATLVNVTGGIGSTRRHKKSFAELTRHIVAAKRARPQEKPQFLRDEMREHYRLRHLGMLSEKAYEASKARILAAHQPASR
jgi:hypothetical protein